MKKILITTKHDVEAVIYNYIQIFNNFKYSLLEFSSNVFDVVAGILILIISPFIFLIKNIINMKEKKIIMLSNENAELINSRIDERLKKNKLGVKVKYDTFLDNYINEIVKEHLNNQR